MIMVRIGIGMLGISAQPKIQKNLQNVVTFKTVISQISEIKKKEKTLVIVENISHKKIPKLLQYP